jgi:hypothetical protein
MLIGAQTMMKRIPVVLILVVALLALSFSLAIAQQPTPDPTRTPTLTPTVVRSAPVIGGLDTKALADTIGQTEFRVVLLITLLFGALGGLVYEMVVLQGSIEQPHRVQEGGWVYDLGVWGRMLMGAMAAIAALYAVPSDSAYKLVAVSVVAGASASAIFKSLQSRVEAMIAQQAAGQAQEAASLIAGKAEQLAETLGVTEPGGSTRTARVAGAVSPEAERRALQLLAEIRMVNSSLPKGSKTRQRT